MVKSIVSNKKVLLFVAGAFLGLGAILYYSLRGTSLIFLSLWVVAILFFGLYFNSFRNKTIPFGRINRKDLLIAFLLISIFVIPYLLLLYEIPFQINSDEIAVMESELRYAKGNLFKLFELDGHFPLLTFITYGEISNLLGGINLFNMRLLHAVTGLLTIGASYLLFRTISDRTTAIIASVLLGINHAFLMISRMALWNNLPVLIEILALFFLIKGLLNKHYFSLFLGGIFAGLSLYVYFPGRVVPLILGIFVIFLLLFYRKEISPFLLGKFLLISSIAFALIITPVIISTLKAPDTSLYYPRHQILIFQEGKKLQKDWVGAADIESGIKKNMINGVLMFNKRLPDYGYIYHNKNHGFFDPATGILIWIGFMISLRKIRLGNTKKERLGNLLMTTSFITIWLIFIFLLTKNPNYTRLLIILPFASFFAAQALNTVFKFLQSFIHKRTRFLGVSKIALICTVASLGGIIFWNVFIMKDYINEEIAQGQDVAGTARYVTKRNTIQNYDFYLLADQNYPYYSWGDQYQWKAWLGFFANKTQTAKVVAPNTISQFYLPYQKSFTLFMSRNLWNEQKDSLLLTYPTALIHKITPDGRLIAFEFIRNKNF